MYGITDITDEKDQIIVNVKRAIAHPDYKIGINYNDIGLVQLEKKIQFNEKARPACLNLNQKFNFMSFTVSGFGKIGVTGPGSSKLLFINVDLYNNTECNDVYRNSLNVPQGVKEDLMICAGSFEDLQDACKGDSGGPLQGLKTDVTDGRMYEIFGIVSFGKPCGIRLRWPGVYTRVSAYVKWIEDTVWS